MEFSLAYEMQRPTLDDHAVIEETIEQCILADEMGFDSVWFVEHHFLEMACRGQVAALAGGSEVVLIDREVCEFAAKQVVESASRTSRTPSRTVQVGCQPGRRSAILAKLTR